APHSATPNCFLQASDSRSYDACTSGFRLLVAMMAAALCRPAGVAASVPLDGPVAGWELAPGLPTAAVCAVDARLWVAAGWEVVERLPHAVAMSPATIAAVTLAYLMRPPWWSL